jgi:hypothetical protein
VDYLYRPLGVKFNTLHNADVYEWVGMLVTVLTPVRELLTSNLDRDIDYTDRFSMGYLGYFRQIPAYILSRLLPLLSKSIPSYHSSVVLPLEVV